MKQARGPDRRWENAKNWLCLNAGIRLVRILLPGAEAFDNCFCVAMKEHSDAGLGEAIIKAFKTAGIETDVDIERDHKEIIEAING